MAEVIKDYKVRIGGESKLEKFVNAQKKMANFQQKQQRSMRAVSKISQSQIKTLRAKDTALAQILKKEEEIAKAQAKAVNSRENARRKQTVSEITKPSGAGKAKDSVFAEQLKKEEALAKKQAKNEARRVRNLNKAKTSVMQTQFMLSKQVSAEQKIVQENIKQQISKAKTADQVRRIVALEKANLKDTMLKSKELKKQNFLLQRMNTSSKQFAGNMVSAFAVVGAGTAIVRTGQDFEAVNNVMLSVSKSSEAAGENFQFVRDEAFRLGVGLKGAAQGFSKMLAARGEMNDDDLRGIFTGVAEASTVLGLTAEEQSRSLNALVQMLSKGKISAEELRLQLGETMPTAIQDMARAAQSAGVIEKSLGINEAVAAMLKLQEQGKLISSEILPHFGKQLSKTFGKGLEKAMDSNRVAMNRFSMSAQEAANAIFKSGLSEGLTDFFNASANFLRDNTLLWESLGRIAGSVLKGLTIAVKILNPVFSAFGSILNAITTTLKDFSALALPLFSLLTYKLLPKMVKYMKELTMGKFSSSAGAAIGRIVAKAYILLGVLEEVAEFFVPTGKKTLLDVNINDVKDELKSLTSPVKWFEGKVDDHKLFTDKLLEMASKDKPSNLITRTPKKEESVILKGDVIMDGERVGSVVAETSSVSEKIDRRLQNATLGSY